MLRIANVYGEGDSGRALPIFVEKCLKGEELTLYGGEQVLDMVHVSDVVEALMKAKLCSLSINIGSGEGISIRNLAERVRDITGSDSGISIGKPRREEVSKFVAEISLARRKLGWEPKVDLEDGLKGLIEHFKKHGKA